MVRKVSIKVAVIILTFLNLIVFIFHRHFTYQPYADYSALYQPCTAQCVNQWKLYVNDYPPSELRQAQVISDSIVGSQPATTRQKILTLGSFIYKRFIHQAGTPSVDLLTASPFQQYRILCTSDSFHLWCGNFAQLFSWFCWSQGIPNRIIEIMHPTDRHVLNECYIGATGQWVMVDVTHNLLLVSSRKDDDLDLPSFRDALQKRETLKAWQVSPEGMKEKYINPETAFIVNYYGQSEPLYYYYRIDNKKVYASSEKLKRYMLPVSWYEILYRGKHSNILFYVKEVLLLLWMLSVFVYLASVTKFRI